MTGAGSGKTVRGTGGACATSHPLAAETGLELLRRGGTAVDAAVGMAAALTVVEPTSNGIGSDAFSMVWAEGALHGLNASGRSPAALTLEGIRDAGYSAMPATGWLPVTVPGAPAAWHDLHERFGKLPFAEVLAPAVSLARDGHRVPAVVARYWERAHRRYAPLEGVVFDGWRETFSFGGRAPREGDRVVLPGHADTLDRIAASGSRDFYEGELASRIDALSRATGGMLRAADLAAHRNLWVEPLAARYRDAELRELPPNGQGVVALEALRILDGLPPGGSWDDPDGVHRCLEALKLAFADAHAHVADPESMRVVPGALLEDTYVSDRRASIGDRAEVRRTGLPLRGGTVYLAAADRDGMMVSYIQSNYTGFGSGVVVPGTGIALQNRGLGFSLEPGHPNAAGPGKRAFHTIIPGFLFREGRPWGPMGVMGGHMQPQGHLQVVRGLVDFGLQPQQVLDLPRWRWEQENRVRIEPGFPEGVALDLARRGHEVETAADEAPFGRGQLVLRDSGETLRAASDRRADGFAGVVDSAPGSRYDEG